MCLGFRVVFQQNERFSEIEEKYKVLHGKTSSLFDMEEEVVKVSKKVRLIHIMLFIMSRGRVSSPKL